MSLTTARDLLTSINILDPIDKEVKSRRHPKNEFQAYAYRLAHDLNDLEHLKIYMKLAKTVERNLMERAYSFVSDSNSEQKGRLFLWKLKQLRTEIQKKRDMQNYDYDFVIKKMSKVRDRLCELIHEKADIEYDENLRKKFHELYYELRNDNRRSKREMPKLLIVGYCSPRLVCELASMGFKVYGIEISKELTKKIKTLCSEMKIGSRVKWVSKDFMQHSFDSEFFDGAYVNGYLSIIPEDYELKFLMEVKKILKKSGKLVINHKASSEDKQEWKIIRHKGEEFEVFVKNISQKKFSGNFQKMNMKIDSPLLLNDMVYYSTTFFTE